MSKNDTDEKWMSESKWHVSKSKGLILSKNKICQNQNGTYKNEIDLQQYEKECQK